FDAETLRQRTSGDIAYHHFEGNDLHLANQLLAHVESLDEVGRNSDIVQVLENIFGDPVVEDALAFNDLVLLRIEGSRVVLEVLDQRSGFGRVIEDIGLAFLYGGPAATRTPPAVVKA